MGLFDFFRKKKKAEPVRQTKPVEVKKINETGKTVVKTFAQKKLEQIKKEQAFNKKWKI